MCVVYFFGGVGDYWFVCVCVVVWNVGVCESCCSEKIGKNIVGYVVDEVCLCNCFWYVYYVGDLYVVLYYDCLFYDL